MRIAAQSSDQKKAHRLPVIAALLLAVLVLAVSFHILAPAQAGTTSAAPRDAGLRAPSGSYPEAAPITEMSRTIKLPGQPLAVEAGTSFPLEMDPAWLAPLTSNAEDTAWGDMDGDGDLDLLVANEDEGPERIYINQDGHLSATTVEFNGGVRVPGCYQYSVALAVGDIDRDGDLDVAVGSGPYSNCTQGDYLRIYRNDTVPGGSIVLTQDWTSSPDTIPARSVALGDLDGDGYLDLAVGTANNFGNRVYRNLSSGGPINMALTWTNSAASNADTSDVALGDVNKDGYLDLAVAAGNRNQLFLNSNGTLNVTPVTWTTFPRNYPRSLSWGDMNGDGWLDLSVGSSNPGLSQVFRNLSGTLQSTPVWTATTTSYASVVAWGDVDGDGDLDLSVGNQQGRNEVYLNKNGLLEATPAWIDPATRETTAVAWGDVDGDGDLELAAATRAGLSVLYENKGGVLPRAARASYNLAYPILPNEALVGQSAAWGDMDRDGDLDLAVGYAALQTVDRSYVAQNCSDYVYRGAPTAVYANVAGALQPAPLWSSNIFSPTTSVAWGDVDGDGDLDLAVGNLDRNAVYRNTGSLLGPTPYWSAATAGRTTSLAWGDVDGDGDLDLVVGNCNTQNQLYLNLGDSNGTLQLSPWSPPSATTYAVAWGDVDGDGDLDLASCGWPSSYLYINQGGQLPDTPSFVIDKIDNDMRSVAWGDYDGDGDLDLAAGIWSGQKRIYKNEGGQLQSPPAWLAQDADLNTSLTWGDMDADGDLDLASGNVSLFSGGAQDRVYLNEHGQLSTVANWRSDSVSNTLAVAWGDVNGDGALDLAALHQNAPMEIFVSQRPKEAVHSNSLAGVRVGLYSDPVSTAHGQISTALAPADFYAVPGIREAGTIPVSYTLTSASTTAVRSIQAFYSPDGGGRWYPALATSDTVTTDLAVDVLVPGSNPPIYSRSYTFTWDVLGSGFLGQSDNVVFQLRANPGYVPAARSSAGSYQQPFVAGQTYPFRVRGTQVRVFSGTTSIDNAMADAIVYRLPYPQTLGAAPFADTTGRPFRTNAQGYLQGRGQININDTLFALLPQAGRPVSATYVSTDVPKAIDVGGVTEVHSIVEVPEGGRILDVNVRNLHGTHTWIRDLSFYLKSPSGTQVEIMARSCGNEDDFSLSLDDEAPPGPWPCPPIDGGAYVPSHPLSIFDGENSGGAWTLVVVDNASGDSGSLDGWGLEITTGEQNGYASTDVPQAIDVDGVVEIHSTLQVPAGGRVVDVNVRNLHGTHTWINDLSFYLESPSGTQVEIMGQSCNDEDDFSLSLDDEAPPGLWPCPPTGSGTYRPSNPLSTFDGESSGGVWTLVVVDNYPWADSGSLDGWELEITTEGSEQSVYTVYATNATPTVTGLSGHTVAAWGEQELVVTAARPLALFNLSVSLEWDARRDTATLNRLQFDLQRASELLFDWTDGQVALGRVNIYQAGEHWNDANVRIFANNRLRPNASQGGLVLIPLSEVISTSLTATQVITYEPGQVRMAVNWNRYGDPGGTIGDDWARAFAHELGHYLLFQDDDYLGYDNAGNFVAVTSCPGAMNDPYSGDKAGGYDEFHPITNWPQETTCANTLANRETGRSDWQTIKRFYPVLNETQETTDATWGPSSLPLAVTQIAVQPLASAFLAVPLDAPTFSLVRSEGGSYAPQRASAYLFQDTTLDEQDDRLVELGSPVSGKVEARGARAGDRLCVFDPEARRVGCEALDDVKRTLALTAYPDWSPSVLVTPETSRTIRIAVSGVAPNVSLLAQLFPRDGAASPVLALTEDSAHTYNGEFVLTTEALEARVHVWVEGSGEATLTSYSIGGNPAPRKPGTSGRSQPPRRFKRAPVLSSDGQAQILGIQGTFSPSQFYALQTVDNFPAPPSWTTVVGQAYRLMKSGGAPDLAGSTFTVNYLDSEVPFGEEPSLTIYFLASCGSSGAGQPPSAGPYRVFLPLVVKSGTQTPCTPTWRALPTTRDPEGDLVAAQTAGEGLYLVLSSIDIRLTPGWNNVSYPVAVTRPVTIALASIAGKYTSVCSYQAVDVNNPWHCFGSGTPPFAGNWVNDLTTMKFGAYWIHATQAVTLSLKGPYGGALVNQPDNADAERPPAIFYGEVKANSTFTAQPGMVVTAKTGDVICGQAKVIEIDGSPKYVVDVRAVAKDGAGSCGQAGSVINFAIDDRPMLPTATWDSSQMWELDLNPAP